MGENQGIIYKKGASFELQSNEKNKREKKKN
jgi:hypothetical protein